MCLEHTEGGKGRGIERLDVERGRLGRSVGGETEGWGRGRERESRSEGLWGER